MRKLWELDESITRSQSNKISQLLKSIQQDQSVIKVKEPIQPAARDPQVNNNKSSRRKQRRGKPTRSKIDASRRSELGHQESPSWAESRRFVPYFVTTTSWHIARWVRQSRAIDACIEDPWAGKLSKPSVPCPTEQDLPRRTSRRPIWGFKKRCPGEPRDYRRSPWTTTDQNPECQRTTLSARKGEQSTGWGIQEALSWWSPTVHQVAKQRLSQTSRARAHDTSNLASNSRAEGIGHDRREELIEKSRNVTDDKQ